MKNIFESKLKSEIDTKKEIRSHKTFKLFCCL